MQARDFLLFIISTHKGGAMAKGEAKQLMTLWPTRKEGMVSGEIETAKLEELVKAAKIGGKLAVKFLGFKNVTPTGKNVLNILARPCDPYQK